jgi:hypothetical protein
MPKSRAAIFKDNLPRLADADIVQLGEGIAVLSFETLPIETDPRASSFLGVRFALSDGSQPTILMDRFACDLLRAAVEKLNSVDWDISRLQGPAGLRPQ